MDPHRWGIIPTPMQDSSPRRRCTAGALIDLYRGDFFPDCRSVVKKEQHTSRRIQSTHIPFSLSVSIV
jgi:hypothetical protein